jgi:hypothetical protein
MQSNNWGQSDFKIKAANTFLMTLSPENWPTMACSLSTWLLSLLKFPLDTSGKSVFPGELRLPRNLNIPFK